MTKKLLIKYIRNEVTQKEESIVLEWISRSAENEKYFISLKNLWVSQNLSTEKASEEDIRNIQRLTTRKNLHFTTYRKYIPYAAAVIMLISIALNIFYFQKGSQARYDFPARSTQLSDLSVDQKHVVYTEKGVKAKITLPDGSKVWLNSDSKITYPINFNGNTREVDFSGEAFFDVAKNPMKPMIVHTNKNFKIEVYGTKFNIRSYDNDSEAQTTLYSGSIRIVSVMQEKGHNKTTEVVTQMKPLESYIIKDRHEPVNITPDDISSETAWKDGRLIFESAPMSEVIKKLERWHGTEFIVKDSTILKYDITAKFRSESIVQIMEMIKFCARVDYKIDSNKVILFKR